MYKCLSIVLFLSLMQWFPKWAVPPPWGRWETLGGRWIRNGRLGAVKPKWAVGGD